MTAYKQTELGLIPSDWEIRKIDDIVKIQTGNRNTQDKIKDGKYPFFVRSQQVERINSYSFDGEGVLTAGDGVGTGKIFHYINGKFDYHQRVYLMHDFSKNNIDGFYFYLFFSNNFYNRIMAMTAKSSVDSVRRDMIAEMYIILPPKPEQTAIATALSNTDALLAELEKLLAKKHAIKTATMQQLLTGKTRLPEFAHRADGIPKGSLKTEWGDIPEDWEVVALGDLAEIQRGASPRPIDNPIWFNQNSNIGWLRISDVTKSGKYLYETVQNLSEEGIKNSRYVEENNLIMSICATVGRPIINKKKICIHDGFVVFNNPNFDIEFMFYILQNYENTWAKHGQTGSQMNLNTDLIKGTKIFRPQCHEQTAIAQILGDMDSEITALQARIEKLREIKQGMMQNLLTGKIRLPF